MPAVAWVDEKSFITVGPKLYATWNVKKKALEKKKGQFGKQRDDNILICVMVDGPSIYCGTSKGNLQLWKGKPTKVVKLHKKKSLDAIHCTEKL